MIESKDVGHRVVVRRVVGERNGRPVFSDVLGELIEFGDAEVTVAGKDGPVRVPRAAIVLSKRIPPRPQR